MCEDGFVGGIVTLMAVLLALCISFISYETGYNHGAIDALDNRIPVRRYENIQKQIKLRPAVHADGQDKC